MRGVGRGLPDAVEQWVGRLERTQVADGIRDAFGANGAKSRLRRTADETEPRVAEAALRPAGNTMRRNLQQICAEIVATTQRLTFRLAVTHQNLCLAIAGGFDEEPARDFASEIEHQGRGG